MLPNARLLEKARAAGARLTDAERQVDAVRAEYYAIVRRLHLAGGSLREIADSLDLSHQRVQQIVNSAGGSWWNRIWRSRNIRRNRKCTFCGRVDRDVDKLIAGPNVFICDACTGGSLGRATSGARCSFCRKRATHERTVLASNGANICAECLEVCRQILIDSSPA